MNQSLAFDLTDALAAVEASGLFSSSCTISAPSQAPDALGQVNLSDYTAVPGLSNIPCMMAPAGTGERLLVREMKTEQQVKESQPFHVLLDGYFPTIRQRYLATIDGQPYNIAGIEWDSQRVTTRMLVERINL